MQLALSNAIEMFNLNKIKPQKEIHLMNGAGEKLSRCLLLVQKVHFSENF